MFRIVFRFCDGLLGLLVFLLLFGFLPSLATAKSSSNGFPGIPVSWRYYLQRVDYNASDWARSLFSLMKIYPAGDVQTFSVCFDAHGRQLNGSKKYRLHFSKIQLPPAEVLWGLMIYSRKRLFVNDQLQRYGLSDRDPLQYNIDGSLDVYIQSSSPGKDKENNWLPSPSNGVFSLGLWMYLYRDAALGANWTLPIIHRVNE